MNRIRLASIVGVALLASCVVVFVGDLEVSWSVDGVKSGDAKCTEYGIDKFEIFLNGRSELLVTCGDRWDSGEFLYGIDEGAYTVEIDALDSGGTALATLSREIDLVDDGMTIWTVSFAFKASDFDGTPVPECGDGTCDSGEDSDSCPEDCPVTGPVCGDGTCEGDEDSTSCPDDCALPMDSSVLISWKINGTTDGDEAGPSWDTCAEVGATQVAITLDGETTTHDCATDAQSATIMGLAAGNHDVSLVLQDIDGNDLTTAAEDVVVAAQTPVEEPFDFYFDSFVTELKETITGDFLFMTLFENGLMCGETVPAVGGKITLLNLDGTPLNVDVCGPGGSSCVATNGVDVGFCSNDTQSISDLTWGSYKIRIKGVPSGSMQTCWETEHATDGTNEIDILVGAGVDNPVVPITLNRVDDTGDCM